MLIFKMATVVSYAPWLSMIYIKPTHWFVPTLLIGEARVCVCVRARARSLFTYLSSHSTNFCMTETMSMVSTRNDVNSDEKVQDLPVPPNHLHVLENFSSKRFHFSHAEDTCWLKRNWIQGVMEWRSVEETTWRASRRKRGGWRRGRERQYL
jgi:hypothetical protein